MEFTELINKFTFKKKLVLLIDGQPNKINRTTLIQLLTQGFNITPTAESGVFMHYGKNLQQNNNICASSKKLKAALNTPTKEQADNKSKLKQNKPVDGKSELKKITTTF